MFNPDPTTRFNRTLLQVAQIAIAFALGYTAPWLPRNKGHFWDAPDQPAQVVAAPAEPDIYSTLTPSEKMAVARQAQLDALKVQEDAETEREKAFWASPKSH